MAVESVKSHGCALSTYPGSIDSSIRMSLFYNEEGNLVSMNLLHSLYFIDYFIYGRANNDFYGDRIKLEPGKEVTAFDIKKDDPTYYVLPSNLTSYFSANDIDLKKIKKQQYENYHYINYESGFVTVTNTSVFSNTLVNNQIYKEVPLKIKVAFEDNPLSYKLNIYKYILTEDGREVFISPITYFCAK